MTNQANTKKAEHMNFRFRLKYVYNTKKLYQNNELGLFSSIVYLSVFQS